MEVRDLQYVIELARLRSFTKAAEALHITQPTLSKMIRSLEQELGVDLFVRIGKRVEVTDAGALICEQGRSIVQAFDNLDRALKDLTGLSKGSIRIGLPPMAGSSFFAGVMSRFRDRYPGLTILMVEDGARKIEKEVAAGSLDMGVIVLPANDEEFEVHSIIRRKLKLIVHPKHRLAGRKQAALRELEHEAFILFREDFALHDIIIGECERAGFRPNVMYESSQWDFIREMVAAGLGVALLPETICDSLDPAHVTQIPLAEPGIPWHLAMIWRRDSYLSHAARAWIHFVQSSFEEMELDGR
ncbi:DNA-binding transcriptional regulator, LysR family [Paenibacillus sp. UNCCL117]|uniref:LysR family transcriptional regulator n=1 Tax=unclassified Paenibacillus TaxID=185978 RepID=UPI000884EA3D|nr:MULTISPECIES: LysR family transcriptional regulator [unclassified Paenibacillus]SDD57963.1 DNA-binding transcriptional regulator, LysR family [Paenibacillus sp. cl123]SFW51088.1 DNA-binding transcriptional regulator, LysR family [Paenibacillus sp. UNCCL117]